MDISPELQAVLLPKETITRAIHCYGHTSLQFRPQHAGTGEWRQYVSYGCEPAGAGRS